MITCKQITKAFYKKHPEIKIQFWLIQGEGYFYLTSDDDEFYRRFAETSIATFRLKHLTLKHWVTQIEWLCEKAGIL